MPQKYNSMQNCKKQTETVVSPIGPYQRHVVILYKKRYTEQEKRIIFRRGLLDWLLPIGNLPSVCEIPDEMQVVFKELTCKWLIPR